MSQIHAAQHEANNNASLIAAFKDDKERQNKYAQDEQRFGDCPLCSQKHTYQKKVGSNIYTWPSSRLSSCDDFMNMNPSERGNYIEM